MNRSLMDGCSRWSRWSAAAIATVLHDVLVGITISSWHIKKTLCRPVSQLGNERPSLLLLWATQGCIIIICYKMASSTIDSGSSISSGWCFWCLCRYKCWYYCACLGRKYCTSLSKMAMGYFERVQGCRQRRLSGFHNNYPIVLHRWQLPQKQWGDGNNDCGCH